MQHLTITAMAESEGDVTKYVAVFNEGVGETRPSISAPSAVHLDALTQLPNRTLLFDRLSQGIRQMTLEQSRLAVFYLNIDSLKKINAQYGHYAGDCVLQETARRLIAEIRENDTVARFGCDEFVVISRSGKFGNVTN